MHQLDEHGLAKESKLLGHLASGDQHAFTTLYRNYSSRLFAKINHLVNDDEIAKELLQDVFMKLWSQREKLDPTKSIKSFLFTIAVNLVYDHFRKLAKDKKYARSILQTAVDYYSHTEEEMHSKESLQLIRQAIDQLPPQRRQIFLMCKIDGKSYEQVANQLSISPSTVRDHIVKGNKIVRDYLLKNPDLIVYSFIATTFLR
ncbi:RNA polymerase ECF-type sigma factor [Pedobacter sp. BAL39]|uniref:RNA polymerase sigma factor n=1 Tax=Pedobacter sp. BAL39 TaxID=391596 RepID=UPI00015596DA|nr:RNA polymerase sigma-70 factor [Pedobacter sp. BAL39]EDM38028.1 RNA polymerase ECF-type sigma factor [Pedobacter sp. BAL39]